MTERSERSDLLDFQSRLLAYIAMREPDGRTPRIEGLERLGGGSSREMYRLRLYRDDQTAPRRIILRKDPPAQGLVSLSERRTEYSVIRSLTETGIPVPKVFWLEEDPRHLGAPFFALSEITGCETETALLSRAPYSDLRESIAKDKWSILGRLAKLDPAALGLSQILEDIAPEDCWKRELDVWETMFERNRLAHQPILAATIRHLRRNPPKPPRKISLVHGDFRTGNFLYGSDGRVHGILDWEMAHLGDPLEDLAYSLSIQWALGNPDLRGNLAQLDQAVSWWEAASDLTVDRDALLWWRLFSTVKCQGLWASGAAGWCGGVNRDMVMVAAAWSCGATHEREALELMGRL